MVGATILPETGRGTSEAGGGGPVQGGVGLEAPSVSASRYHLPVPGRIA